MVYSIVLKHRINLVIRLVVTKEGRSEDMPEAQPMHRVASCPFCELVQSCHDRGETEGQHFSPLLA